MIFLQILEINVSKNGSLLSIRYSSFCIRLRIRYVVRCPRKLYYMHNRQNMGATHFIVGRDHAGVGDFYGAFEAQDIFDKLPSTSQLKIKIFKADHTAFSKKLRKVVMMNEVHDHSPSDFIFLSGTRLRSMLENGQTPPGEVVRSEVLTCL